MDGIGANSYAFPIANDVGWNWEQVRFVFDELDINYIRMASWFGLWEEENDNADPYNMNMDSFDPRNIMKNHDLPFAQYLTERNVEVELGIWSHGDWLAFGDPKTVPPDSFPEVGEAIAAYLIFMEDNGVQITQTEVQNEPDIEAGINYLTAENLAAAAVQVIDQLDKNGFTNVNLHGPNLHSPENTVEWGQVMFGSPDLTDRLSAVTYHTWWVDDYGAYNKIWEYAQSVNKPVWATEVGYCALSDGCFNDTHFLLPDTWETAWDYAMSHYRAIAWSHASRSYHWPLLGHDAVVSKSGQRYPSFYVLKHFANYIQNGATLVYSSMGRNGLYSMVFKLPDGTYTCILINDSKGGTLIELGDRFTVTEICLTKRTKYYSEPEITKNDKGEEGYFLPDNAILSLKFQ